MAYINNYLTWINEDLSVNRKRAINVKGVLIYTSDDNKGHLVFEKNGFKKSYKVTAKIVKLGVTLWSGSISVKQLTKFADGTIKIIDNTGKNFNGESIDLVPLVDQFIKKQNTLTASIGIADLNLVSVA